jgi:two-component system, OmpR family, copper resistance phosphate regulon response regulator CusR
MLILVVEDNGDLAEFVCQRLRGEHFEVQLAPDGEAAIKQIESRAFNLILLDLDIPKISGLDVLKHIRGKSLTTPVIILTGAGNTADRVRGLDAGADDYVTKPFSYVELSARIRAVLRRGEGNTAVLKVDDLELDRIQRKVRRGGRAIELTQKEFGLLEFLMQQAGQRVSRGAIVEAVWRAKGEAMTNVVDVYINYLRRKVDLGFEKHLIRTVRGVGYQIGGE